MTLKFCPECKSILIPYREGDKFVFKCGHCDYSRTEAHSKDLITSEKGEEPEERGEGVASEKNEFATYDHECKKCGYGKAQVLDLGIFYSDEDNLILLKCGKCGFAEKIGRKTS